MRYFKRKLDDKNRLTMPVELRPEFEGGIILTPGFENYLHLYSKKVWEEDMESALEGRWKGDAAKPAIIDQELADLTDRFTDGMVETMLDAKQGRVTIDPDLLRYAGIAMGGEIVATRMPGNYWRLKASKR
jgi:MraZ protein